MVKFLRLLLAIAVFSHAGMGAPRPLDWHFEFSGGAEDKLVWQGETGRFYDLFVSTDLGTWSHVLGFPGLGAGGAMEHRFTPLARGFFRIRALPVPEMILIPAGSFQMGDALDGISDAPVHTVDVSEFHMQNIEVTNDQMASVLQWAYDQGGRISVTTTAVRNLESDQSLLSLSDRDCRITWDATSQSFGMKVLKASAYPCIEVSWYGAAAYCNYLSAMEGLTPCYDLTDWSCDLDKDGYRLPTEAEWEKAARGDLAGKRFPWGDTITHCQANYQSSSAQTYDLSPTRGYHPDWAVLGIPYTSPAGSFPATGEGLYDMIGNVGEWCNDWYSGSYYGSSPGNDPTGPVTGSRRIMRGGIWGFTSNNIRVAYRWNLSPTTHGYLGFRPVRR